MLSGAAIIRRNLAGALSLPRILRRNCSRKESIEDGFACRPGELCPASTEELASRLAMPRELADTRTLAYVVRRGDPELVGPASLTPREIKPLSDLDDIDVMRRHMSIALFYRGREDGVHVHPAGVIRRALREALVHYYPLAGRLRKIEGHKLAVDCTGEGVLFVQADADVKLAELEAAGLRPPFPSWDQLLFDAEGCLGVLNSPLLLIQVTRLLCGGFVVGLRFNHTICDGIGTAQFVKAVSELARGLPSMTVKPVWCRELIKASSTLPLPSFPHPYLELDLHPPPLPGDEFVSHSFTFSALHVAAIKKSLPHPLRATATTFEALAAFVWRARTAALELPPGQDSPLVVAVNFRGPSQMCLPMGYYGNAAVPSTALLDAAALCRGSLGDAVALVRLAKAAVTTDYVRSVVDQMVLLGRRMSIQPNWFSVSDARRLGFHGVDFGWGNPVFAGPADTFFRSSFFITVKDGDGQDVVGVTMVLPRLAMLRFAANVERSLVELKPCHG